MARAIDANALHAEISKWPESVMYKDWVQSAIANAPTLTPQNAPERAGLYGKYTVRKNSDGSLVTDCFVLRPGKDPAAVAALRAYAAATDNAELAVDIINWVGADPNEPLTLERLREMDGEPVWLDVADGVWALVDANDDCVWLDRGGSININKLAEKVYRRPPERQEDT